MKLLNIIDVKKKIKRLSKSTSLKNKKGAESNPLLNISYYFFNLLSSNSVLLLS